MTAPTSRMTPEPADPNDLRTALTKLADKWLSNKDRPSDYQDGVADAACAIRALLAAHPAPATVPAWATLGTHLTASCSTCGESVRNEDDDVLWFRDAADAMDHVTEYADGQIDGDTLTCAACLAKAACEAVGGHDIQTITQPGRPGLAWYCAREHCPARGMVREEAGA